jgi:hypothetical protein
VLRGAAFYILLFCAIQTALGAQNQDPPAVEAPADQYFSGTVVSFSAEKLTVARTILGTSPSSRSFVITPETQIDGKLRARIRVTVQYVTKDDVDQAVRIVVRTNDPKKQR